MEELYSIKTKYVDKWLNFGRTYVTRVNIALFVGFISNWQNLILTELNIYIGDFFKFYEKV
jgi:hypothetical protein